MHTLLDRGLAYRYPKDAWENLRLKGGLPFPSPHREVNINGEPYIDELIQPPVAPALLTRAEADQLERLARAWKRFTELQAELARVALMHAPPVPIFEAIRELIPENQLPFATYDPGYSCVIPFLRLDCIRVPGEGIKVLDINSTRPAGIGDMACIEGYLDGNEIGAPLPIGKGFVDVVFECFREWSQNTGNRPCARIGIIVPETTPDWHNWNNIIPLLQEQEWVDDVRMIAEVPSPDDARFNLIMRGRIKEGSPAFAQLAALPTTRFCVMSPLFRRFMGDKRWFLILTDDRFASFFSDQLGDDYEIIREAIPRTGRVKEGVVWFPDTNGNPISAASLTKPEWILKPAAGSSAQGIVIGRSTSTHLWQSLLRGARNGTLLQRFYRVKELMVLLDADGRPFERMAYVKLGAYLYGGRFIGCEYMHRDGALVHGARDTAWTVCRIEP